jgi:hypothetical protein
MLQLLGSCPVHVVHELSITDGSVANEWQHTPFEKGPKPSTQVALVHSLIVLPVQTVQELVTTEASVAWLLQQTPPW